jgi:Domain of unknown function (DUF6285)
MPERPTALELIEAVTEFLAEEVVPAASDHRQKFRTLVALNALGIAYRELESDEPRLSDEELAELARRIRADDVDETMLPQLKEHVAAKLRISNPAYLERYV